MNERRRRRPKIVTACVLIIGNEILSGRTQDANLAFLAQGLNEVGIRLREARVIPDDRRHHRRHRQRGARASSITSSRPAGSARPMTTSPRAVHRRGVRRPADPASRGEAAPRKPLPAGRAQRGAAAHGAWCRKAPRCCPTRSRARPASASSNVFVLPGVPQIMQAIFDELKHRLKGGAKVLSRSVSCSLGEGTLAQDLGGAAGALRRSRDRLLPLFPARRFRRDAGGARHRPDRVCGAATEELKALIRSLGGDPQEGTERGLSVALPPRGRGEMVDAADLKSASRQGVRVRFPPSAP